jgi:RNA ligase (TIGR02306 family)
MKLASIEVIKSIKPHSNADSLEIAQVLGWQTIVKSGLHKEGDKILFITIDTIIPRYPWTDFLADKNNPDKPIRLKMIKLRGEHSAGLVIPLSEFPPRFADMEVGEDLTELIGIQKYVKEIPANIAGENIGDFPSQLAPKTDEDNGLSDPKLVEEIIKHQVTITQKLDGSSCTIVVEDGIITQVCSRNLSKKDTNNSAFWNAAKKLSILPGFNGVIQGELCGPGIQRNTLKLSEPQIFVFQIKKQDGSYMNFQEMKGFCNVEMKCNVVPFIAECSFVGCDNDTALSKLQELADQQTLPDKSFAEGIVVRPTGYPRSPYSRRPFGFKILNRNYKDT